MPSTPQPRPSARPQPPASSSSTSSTGGASIFYTLSSGTKVGFVEPTVGLLERSVRLVPAGTPALAAMRIQGTELLRLCLRRVDGRTVSYQELRGDGLEKVFAGARGVRDVDQCRMILDRLTDTSEAEDRAVLATARPTEEEPTPEDETTPETAPPSDAAGDEDPTE